MGPFNHFTACMPDFSGTLIRHICMHIVHSLACSILPCVA